MLESEHFQRIAQVPLSKVPNPQMLGLPVKGGLCNLTPLP